MKESDRIAGIVEGLRGLGGDLEATDGRLRRARDRRPTGRDDRLARATTGSRWSAPSPASPAREGVEVVGMEAAAVSYPGFAADLAGLVA